MTVKDLKEAIKDLPDNMDVMIHQTWEESAMSIPEKATVQEVTFGAEEIDPKDYGVENCLVISDEL